MTHVPTEQRNKTTHQVSFSVLACTTVVITVIMSFPAFAGEALSGNFHRPLGNSSVIAGGQGCNTHHDFGFIGGGTSNFLGGEIPKDRIVGEGGTIGGGHGNMVWDSWGTISGGSNNHTRGVYSTVGGGKKNEAGLNNQTPNCTVGGGSENKALGQGATVGGGAQNTAEGVGAAIGGGWLNQASKQHATVGGGSNNEALANGATIGGGGHNKAPQPHATIGGGLKNTAHSIEATISGGSNNTTSGNLAAIGGGSWNTVTGVSAVIGGGEKNKASKQHSTVGGGSENNALATGATVGGGAQNTAEGIGAAIGGGWHNQASKQHATVGGGTNNTASGVASTVPGGELNIAEGDYSFAAGREAYAKHRGSFVWADADPDVVPQSSGQTDGSLTTTGREDEMVLQKTENDSKTLVPLYFESSDKNQFCVRARGGVRFATNAQGTVGVKLEPGSNDWDILSDRNAKTDIAPVDRQRILDALARIPVSTWRYKTQTNKNVQHIGPMAQDFHAAFGLGGDDRYIGTLDANGVALAAIQALHDQHENQKQEIRDLTNHNEKLVQRIEKLEALIQSMQQQH